MQILEVMMNDPAVRELVDEFYFEHHVDNPIMRKYWGPVPGTSFADSYSVMLKLRRAGVRSHWWP